eukprot:g33002.t1
MPRPTNFRQFRMFPCLILIVTTVLTSRAFADPLERIPAKEANPRILGWQKEVKDAGAKLGAVYGFGAGRRTLELAFDQENVGWRRRYLGSWSGWITVDWHWASHLYGRHHARLRESSRVVVRAGYATQAQMEYLERGMKAFREGDRQMARLWAERIRGTAVSARIGDSYDAAKGARRELLKRILDRYNERYQSIKREVTALQNKSYFFALRGNEPQPDARLRRLQFAQRKAGNLVAVKTVDEARPFYVQGFFNTQPRKTRENVVVTFDDGRTTTVTLQKRTRSNPLMFESAPLTVPVLRGHQPSRPRVPERTSPPQPQNDLSDQRVIRLWTWVDPVQPQPGRQKIEASFDQIKTAAAIRRNGQPVSQGSRKLVTFEVTVKLIIEKRKPGRFEVLRLVVENESLKMSDDVPAKTADEIRSDVKTVMDRLKAWRLDLNAPTNDARKQEWIKTGALLVKLQGPFRRLKRLRGERVELIAERPLFLGKTSLERAIRRLYAALMQKRDLDIRLQKLVERMEAAGAETSKLNDVEVFSDTRLADLAKFLTDYAAVLEDPRLRRDYLTSLDTEREKLKKLVPELERKMNDLRGKTLIQTTPTIRLARQSTRGARNAVKYQQELREQVKSYQANLNDGNRETVSMRIRDLEKKISQIEDVLKSVALKLTKEYYKHLIRERYLDKHIARIRESQNRDRKAVQLLLDEQQTLRRLYLRQLALAGKAMQNAVARAIDACNAESFREEESFVELRGLLNTVKAEMQQTDWGIPSGDLPADQVGKLASAYGTAAGREALREAKRELRAVRRLSTSFERQLEVAENVVTAAETLNKTRTAFSLYKQMFSQSTKVPHPVNVLRPIVTFYARVFVKSSQAAFQLSHRLLEQSLIHKYDSNGKNKPELRLYTHGDIRKAVGNGLNEKVIDEQVNHVATLWQLRRLLHILANADNDVRFRDHAHPGVRYR